MKPWTVVALAIVLAAGCRLAGRQVVEVEPGVTFVAHEAHQRIVIDHAPGGRTGALVPPAWFRRPGEPTWVVRIGKDTPAGLWLEGPARVRVRARSSSDPILARVDPAWEDGAIRLTLAPSAGAALAVGPFARVGTGVGPSELSRRAQTTLDVRGTYQADLLDGAGKPVGWWRVKISPYAASPRIYEAVLPESVDLSLAAATVVALRGEVDWIEAHVLDVYRGDSSGSRLEQSIPLGR